MHRFLTLPILVPMLLGVALLVSQPKGRRIRNIYVTASTLVTSILSFLCILITYGQGPDALACILVIVGFFLYKESLSPQQIIGIAVCIFGLFLISK